MLEEDAEGGKAGLSRKDRDRGGAEAVGDPPLDLAPVDVHFGEEALCGGEQVSTVGEDRKHQAVGQPMAEMWSDAFAGRGEPLDRGECSLGEGEASREMGRGGQVWDEPIS